MILDPVYLLSDDQLANQFEIVFPNGIPGDGDKNAISMRMDQSIQPPSFVSNMYDYYMRGIKYSKPGMLEETTKELSVMVRIDQAWKVFDDLYKWKLVCHDTINGTRSNSKSGSSKVNINMLDGNDKIKKTFFYEYVYLKELALETLANDSGDPLRVNLVMVYNTVDVGVQAPLVVA